MNGAQTYGPDNQHRETPPTPGQGFEGQAYEGRAYAGPPPAPQQAAGKIAALRKSPALATVLSLMPGLGQIYVGYYQQGFICLMTAATVIAILASGGGGRGGEPFFGMFLAFFWIFNMIDANRRAQHYNLALMGLSDQELPEDFQGPGAKGSVAGGLLLVVVGTLLFLDVKFGVSLEWLEDWWPVALIGFGIWLILKTRHRAK